MAARHLRNVLILLSLFLVGSAAWGQSEHPDITRMRRDVMFLASPECEGRGVQTQGIHKAADYIVREFTKAGLVPGGTKQFFQPFAIFGTSKLEGKSTLKLKG